MSLTINKAKHILAEGGIICFPTDTIYALAANATNDAALKRIYNIKNRDPNKPLSLLLKNKYEVHKLCHINQQAEALLEAYMPGALTLILPLKANNILSPLINNNNGTIGVRIPDHKNTLDLLNNLSFPVIGTSVNLSGFTETNNAEEILSIFDNDIDLIITTNEDRNNNIASTVLDLTQDQPVIIRQGIISRAKIGEIINI